MNPEIKIAVCNRKTDKKYKNLEMSWEDIKTRNSNPIRTTETVDEYPKLSKARRDAAKDQGGFVGGWLKDGIRKNGHITCRTLGTLDADHIPKGEDFTKIVASSYQITRTSYTQPIAIPLRISDTESCSRFLERCRRMSIRPSCD